MNDNLSQVWRESHHNPERLKEEDLLTINFVGHHNAWNLWTEFPQLLVPAVQVLVSDFPLHIKHLPRKNQLWWAIAGELLINHQIQNPEFSKEDINKGNWCLLESVKDKGEYPESLETCSQPTSLHGTGNSPSFSFTVLFCTMTNTASSMTSEQA